MKPKVEFIGRGNILPISEGLNMNFRAIGLTSVQVRVYKIFENNIALFMQNNYSFDGSSALRQAGRLVVKKSIPLDGDKSLDLNAWNSFALDLGELFDADKGALYRVELAFKRDNTLHFRDENTPYNYTQDDALTERELEYFNNPDNYNYYEDYYYGNWSDREKPEKDAYYHSGRYAKQNIMASNIGVIAKSGTNNEMVIAVNNLLTTEPIEGATVEVYDYQNQLISSAISNSEGLANISLNNKPFVLIVKSGDERAYMRVSDAWALSATSFDVSGVTAKRGLKAYIYGERGVWRPGDDIYLSLILEDKSNTLPIGHPINFELRNALGQLVKRELLKVTDSNLYTLQLSTDSEAPTGKWEARFVIGGATFSKYLRVESVKPNRLKVEVDFAEEMITSQQGKIDALLKASWLHGAPANTLRSRVDATFIPIKTTFKGYDNYIFDNPAKAYKSSEFTIFDGKTDTKGDAVISKKLSQSHSSPGMLKANIKARVFEESGDFSVNTTSTLYSPYKSYIGIKLPKESDKNYLYVDKDYTVDVVKVSEKGAKVEGSDKVSYTLYKIDWRWWWESSNENLARYTHSSSQIPYQRGTITLTDGKGSLNLRVNDNDWGRYLLVLNDYKDGHSVGSAITFDWASYRNKPIGDNLEAATVLAVTTDKKSYDVGERATLTFASLEGGRALVSLENGREVLKEFWVTTTKDFTTVELDIDSSMTPNIYAYVSLLQPHAQTENNLPIRMYGIVSVGVSDKSTELKPQISMANELRPEEEVEITISEENGKEMFYTLSVVEDGLLDLTNFKTPSPHSHFYAREALGVRTWDMYNSVIGAYGGKIESVFGIGGDADMESEQSNVKANRFDPMVKVLGVFELKAGETQKHTFKMPNYVGSVRTMVVAKSKNSYGSSEKTTPVRKPLMALATLPRVVSIGEEVTLPVTIFAMDSKINKVDIDVECNNLFSFKGGSKGNLTFNSVGDKIASFTLQVGEKTGVGKVKVIATSAGERAVHEIEITVRNPNTPIITSVSRIAKATSDIEIPYELIGAKGTNSLWVECSVIAPIDYERRMKYLNYYPHSCIEQITSSAFPRLYAEKFCQLTDNEREQNSWKIKSVINRVSSYMTSDGGLSYWAGEGSANDWGTSYCGHFLLEAEKIGYALPLNFRSRWIRYQSDKAMQWRQNSRYEQLNQAYRLYTLALAGAPNNSAMNRMVNMQDLTIDAAYRLAAAYALIGRHDVAKTLIGKEFKNNDIEYSYSYGSSTRNMAMRLETLSLLNLESEAAPLIKELSSSLSSDSWLSTQTLAYSLVALSRWIPAKGEDIKFEYSVNGGTKVGVTTDRAIFIKEIEDNLPNKGVIKITNKGNNSLFTRIILEGTPIKGDTINRSSNIRLAVEYLDLKGGAINVERLKQGTDFMAVVTVTHPGGLNDYQDISLSQIIPAGWEIRNMRMDGGVLPIRADKPRYQDIRDDRVYSYFDLKRGQSLRFVVMLNATYKGNFYLPPVACEAMYDNTITANTAGKQIEVI